MNSKLRFYLRGLGIGILVTAVILIAVKLSTGNGEMTDAEIKRRAAELGMVEANTYSLIDATALHTDGEDEAAQDSDTSSPVEIDPNKTGEISNKDTEKDSNGSGSFIGDTDKEETEVKEDTDKTDTDKSETAADEKETDNTDTDKAEKTENTAETEKTEETGNAAEGDKTTENTDTAEADKAEDTGNATDTDKTEDTGNTADTDKTEDTGNAADTDKTENTDNNTDTSTENALEEGTAVTITIARGSASETAAAILKNAGLITDAVDFNNYMIKNGYDRRIHPGTFEIKAGSTYEEICKIIAG